MSSNHYPVEDMEEVAAFWMGARDCSVEEMRARYKAGEFPTMHPGLMKELIEAYHGQTQKGQLGCNCRGRPEGQAGWKEHQSCRQKTQISSYLCDRAHK